MLPDSVAIRHHQIALGRWPGSLHPLPSLTPQRTNTLAPIVAVPAVVLGLPKVPNLADQLSGVREPPLLLTQSSSEVLVASQGAGLPIQLVEQLRHLDKPLVQLLDRLSLLTKHLDRAWHRLSLRTRVPQAVGFVPPTVTVALGSVVLDARPASGCALTCGREQLPFEGPAQRRFNRARLPEINASFLTRVQRFSCRSRSSAAPRLPNCSK